MHLDAPYIINSIEKNYPKVALYAIANGSDEHIEQRSGIYRQFIIGVTKPDTFGGVISIRSYEQKMLDTFPAYRHNLKVLGWPFDEYLLDDMEKTLEGLSKYYEAKLDVASMMQKARKWKMEPVYLVVTILEIPVITAA
jgi:hypothetical protein